MSGFSADWLSLREPFDLRARNPAVLNAVIGAFRTEPRLRITDLGCGTGSTLRALAPRLVAEQKWRLVDNDPALLARAADNSAAPDVSVETLSADLDRELVQVLQSPADLVTMSALLDLVSDEWLERLVRSAVERRLSVYAALSYDGRVELAPEHRLDEAIGNAVDQHQRGDKGLGPALGPLAAKSAIAKFTTAGFSVVHGPADWTASERDRAFQTEIVRGWAQAAHEIGTLSSGDVADWLAFRENEIAAGRSAMLVGHIDLFASPPSR